MKIQSGACWRTSILQEFNNNIYVVSIEDTSPHLIIHRQHKIKNAIVLTFYKFGVHRILTGSIKLYCHRRRHIYENIKSRASGHFSTSIRVWPSWYFYFCDANELISVEWAESSFYFFISNQMMSIVIFMMFMNTYQENGQSDHSGCIKRWSSGWTKRRFSKQHSSIYLFNIKRIDVWPLNINLKKSSRRALVYRRNQ